MSSKFLNISTDNTLGGNSPSHDVVSSQKAIKEYIDNQGSASSLSDLSDVSLSSPSEGQVLTYNNADDLWENVTPTSAIIRTWSNS